MFLKDGPYSIPKVSKEKIKMYVCDMYTNFVTIISSIFCTSTYNVEYEGGSESSVIGVLTLLIDMIDCCIIL